MKTPSGSKVRLSTQQTYREKPLHLDVILCQLEHMSYGARHTHHTSTTQSDLDFGDRMTLDKLLSQMGAGQLTDRFSEYGAPGQEQLFYGYEPSAAVPPVHSHEVIHKYSYGGGHGGGGHHGHHKSNAAMSALTLLAFLFFLHILQQCIKDHMTAMSTPQIMIVTGGREGETLLKKSDTKLDKTGVTAIETRVESNDLNKIIDEKLMKINTAEPPKGGQRFRNPYKSYSNKTLDFNGFVSAMDVE